MLVLREPSNSSCAHKSEIIIVSLVRLTEVQLFSFSYAPHRPPRESCAVSSPTRTDARSVGLVQDQRQQRQELGDGPPRHRTHRAP